MFFFPSVFIHLCMAIICWNCSTDYLFIDGNQLLLMKFKLFLYFLFYLLDSMAPESLFLGQVWQAYAPQEIAQSVQQFVIIIKLMSIWFHILKWNGNVMEQRRRTKRTNRRTLIITYKIMGQVKNNRKNVTLSADAKWWFE